MEKEKDSLQEAGKILEQAGEELLDALSLVILLENDMEAQKSDSVHIRIVKILHDRIKGILKNLPEGSRQTD